MRRDPDRQLRDLKRRLLRQKATSEEELSIRAAIRQIPKGKVATYGQVAAAAGYPLHHRQVVRILRDAAGRLPWQRVLGAGGEIKLKGEAGLEQRRLLTLEGVTFRGKKVRMALHQFTFRVWELERELF